jgi:hypothetical protein
MVWRLFPAGGRGGDDGGWGRSSRGDSYSTANRWSSGLKSAPHFEHHGGGRSPGMMVMSVWQFWQVKFMAGPGEEVKGPSNGL